jgi:hypothetical protein
LQAYTFCQGLPMLEHSLIMICSFMPDTH